MFKLKASPSCGLRIAAPMFTARVYHHSPPDVECDDYNLSSSASSSSPSSAHPLIILQTWAFPNPGLHSRSSSFRRSTRDEVDVTQRIHGVKALPGCIRGPKKKKTPHGNVIWSDLTVAFVSFFRPSIILLLFRLLAGSKTKHQSSLFLCRLTREENTDIHTDLKSEYWIGQSMDSVKKKLPFWMKSIKNFFLCLEGDVISVEIHGLWLRWCLREDEIQILTTRTSLSTHSLCAREGWRAAQKVHMLWLRGER